MEQGIIFNIQKFSVHDGPGIRTTVFMKGCPLRCKWCHNPEGQVPGKELVTYGSRCLGCGSCVDVCPTGAVSIREANDKGSTGVAADNLGVAKPHARAITDRAKCIVSGACTEVCPTGAREIAGKIVSSSWVMEEVVKDRIFYDQSGGGVTFSGGEPLMQPNFLYELCTKCKEEGIHVAVDTSGCASWEVLERIALVTDMFLYDVKMIDEAQHVKYTGASNKLVLENLIRLSEAHADIVARIPIIPGVNDDDKSVDDLGKYLSTTTVKRADLLPYHSIGADKYDRLGRIYELSTTPEPTEERMLNIKERLEGFGLKVRIGG